MTTNKDLNQPAFNSLAWDVPLNANFGSIDLALGGTTTLNATGASGINPLTPAQYTPLILSITGVLSANVDYQIPISVGGQWIVANSTTGAFTVTISSEGGGASLVIAAGTRRLVYSDGTNIRSSFSVLQIAEGGTGGITASEARDNLGVGSSNNVSFQSVSDIWGNLRKVPENVQGGSYTLVLSDSGKYISTTSNVNVPAGIFVAGDTVTVFNYGSGTLTISQGVGTTMYLAGVGTTGNRTLSINGLATVLCVASNTFVITGAGLL